jgi:hypothetical protein
VGSQHADAQDPGARHGGGAAQRLKLRRAAAAALALAGLVITLVAYRPGLVTTDSIAQYEQAVAGTYTDAHPPVMAWLWSGLLHFAPGAAGLLWLHAILLWLALLLFADGAALRGARHAWLVVVVGFLPPILGTAGEIWKDVGMAASLLCAAAIVYRASARGAPIGRGSTAIALVLIFYATAVRANAPAASGPILVYWAMGVWPQLALRRAIGAAAAVLVLLLAAQWGLEARVIGAKRAHLAQQLETFDLVAMRCSGGDARIPRVFLQAGAREDALCAAFDPTRVDTLYSLPTSPLRQDTDRTALRDLARRWREAILADPGAYLAHRAMVFAGVLGFGVADASRSIWIPFAVANPYGLDYRYNGVAAAIGATVAFAAALGLYNGVPWLVLALGIGIAGVRRHDRAFAAETALAWSALLYTLAYFFVAIAPDYRYLYWTVLSTAVAGALTIARRPAWLARAPRALAVGARNMPSAGLAALGVAGLVLTLVAYFPGELTFDSVWQYDQAIRHSYGDHHPPLMAWLWSVLDRVVHGPFGMLLLQVALMWAALVLIADGARRRGLRHAWLVVAVGFLPPILGSEGEIWKDVQLAASLLIAFALVYRSAAGGARMHPVLAAIALVPLFYATAARANAAAASLLIAAYWAHVALRRATLARSLAAGALVVAVMLGMQVFVDRVLLEARRDYLSQFLAVFDIAAIRCHGGEASIPAAMVRAGGSAAAICAAFDPYKVDFLFAPEGAPLERATERSVVGELWADWGRAVLAHPLLYAEHRVRAFGALLGFGTHDDDVRRPVWIPSSIPNAYGFTFAPNQATQWIGASTTAARAAGLYNGVPWLAIALVVVVAMRRRTPASSRDAGALALASSALLYALPYLVIAIAPDYRYLYWTVVASAVAGVLALLPTARFTTFARRCERVASRIGRSAVRHREAVVAIAVAALGLVVEIVAFWPGIVSYDSLIQYQQAIGVAAYTDHHPAVMAWVWALLLHVLPGPAPMLVLHAAMTWTALALLALGALRRGRCHAWTLPFAGFAPVILGMQGPIWKDVGMTSAFLLGAAIVYVASASRPASGRALVAAGVPLFYATAVRANAPAAALPLLVYAASRWRGRGRVNASLAIGAALLAALLAIQWGLARSMQVRHAHFAQYIEAFDIAAIRCGGGDAALPAAFIVRSPTALPLCEAFDPVQVDFLFANGAKTPLTASDDRSALRELGTAWRHAIATNPGLYLGHRARVFAAMMGVGIAADRRAPFLQASLGNPYGFAFAPNALTGVIGASVAAAVALQLTNGFLWLAVAAIVVVVATRRLRLARADDDGCAAIALALASSALAYALPYFFVGVAPDLRYLDWVMAATLIAAILVALPRRDDAR